MKPGSFTRSSRIRKLIKFHYLVSDLGSAKSAFDKSGAYALLYIPKTELALPSGAVLYSKTQVNIGTKDYIRTVMSRQLEEMKLEAKLRDIQPEKDVKQTTDDILRSIKATVEISYDQNRERGRGRKKLP